MYNDFVVLGPPDDPAGIKGLGSVAEAFRRIAETGSTFASRGDESGTHAKEMQLWAEAGIDSPEDEDWYMSLGQGMGGTLTTANEMRAYTLSDRGTYLARVKLDLVVLTEGDELLFNPYHVMIVNPEKFPNVQVELARLFVDFLSVPVPPTHRGTLSRQWVRPGNSMFCSSMKLKLGRLATTRVGSQANRLRDPISVIHPHHNAKQPYRCHAPSSRTLGGGFERVWL